MSRRALVVGGSGETGGAVVAKLIAEGWEVTAIQRGVRPITSAFDYTVILRDLMDPQMLELTAAQIMHGLIGPFDAIVHVIGGSLGLRDHTLPAREWANVWQFNVGIPHEINRVALPGMVERGWGRIVHFSSNGVKLATGTAPYTSAKSALEGYVRMMGKQYAAQGVVITAVSPGPIYTEGRFMYSQDEAWTRAFFEKYVPMGRWGTGDEIAGVVSFLCSDAASYMAGAIVPVDGSMR